MDINALAARLAERINGGKFDDPKFYTEEQRELWRGHAAFLFGSDTQRAFVEKIANLTTLEDEFAADPQEYDDVDDMRADLSDDRLLDEFSTLEGLIEEAREILGRA